MRVLLDSNAYSKLMRTMTKPRRWCAMPPRS